ncbi:MAG: tyrosine-type recombinase/integrase [Prevotella sp.]|nr:tyrosine-type recombinase/integrase [Prevotella sp.]
MSIWPTCGVSRHLTSYVSRHTWASTAYSENVDLAVISKALGHSNPHHTLIYIRQIDDQRLNDANRHLIDSLQHVP